MRVWDLSTAILCRHHLLGEHREIHAIWSIITENKKGYSFHPETIRWRGKLAALYLRHQEVAEEMIKRGYNHTSLLDKNLAVGESVQMLLIDDIPSQKRILKRKQCECRISARHL